VTITVIGWYGSETIGDRGILAGLIDVFSGVFGNFDIRLGSMVPFFSERTIREDTDFYHKYLAQGKYSVTVFDVTRHEALKEAIRRSELVVVGGGPLIDIDDMFMLRYAFKTAKRHRKKTLSLLGSLGIPLRGDEVTTAIDPAAFAALRYRGVHPDLETDGSVCVNVRLFTKRSESEQGKNSIENVNQFLARAVHEIAAGCSANRVVLLPNHYFGIGGDDRFVMNRIRLLNRDPNVIVQNVPLSLEGTFDAMRRAIFCVGMRFHSVLMQSLVNGDNYIMDYTDPVYGKTVGFLKQVDSERFYADRYLSLHSNDLTFPFRFRDRAESGRFPIPEERLKKFAQSYVSVLRKLI
jgi:polysaccharide pyruvyl transferase WcaK-like protein